MPPLWPNREFVAGQFLLEVLCLRVSWMDNAGQRENRIPNCNCRQSERLYCHSAENPDVFRVVARARFRFCIVPPFSRSEPGCAKQRSLSGNLSGPCRHHGSRSNERGKVSEQSRSNGLS